MRDYGFQNSHNFMLLFGWGFVIAIILTDILDPIPGTIAS